MFVGGNGATLGPAAADAFLTGLEAFTADVRRLRAQMGQDRMPPRSTRPDGPR